MLWHNCRKVCLAGRRGPARAASAAKELREIGARETIHVHHPPPQEQNFKSTLPDGYSTCFSSDEKPAVSLKRPAVCTLYCCQIADFYLDGCEACDQACHPRDHVHPNPDNSSVGREDTCLFRLSCIIVNLLV
ncbi:hypothetical protein NC651_021208 [Populus alba x Populus x berolinensis]|nr:hypothetical protein NC651_021208 [Populus alba x Populus x berolinensis]